MEPCPSYSSQPASQVLVAYTDRASKLVPVQQHFFAATRDARRSGPETFVAAAHPKCHALMAICPWDAGPSVQSCGLSQKTMMH